MKKNINSWPCMIIVALALLLLGCDHFSKKDQEKPMELTDEKAMMLAERTLVYSEAGLVYDLAQSARIADEHLSSDEAYDSCGQAIDLDLSGDLTGIHTSYYGQKTKTVSCLRTNIPVSVKVKGVLRLHTPEKPMPRETVRGFSDFNFQVDDLDDSNLLVSGTYHKEFLSLEYLFYVNLDFETIILDRNTYRIKEAVGTYIVKTGGMGSVEKELRLVFAANGFIYMEVGNQSKTINPFNL